MTAARVPLAPRAPEALPYPEAHSSPPKPRSAGGVTGEPAWGMAGEGLEKAGVENTEGWSGNAKRPFAFLFHHSLF